MVLLYGSRYINGSRNGSRGCCCIRVIGDLRTGVQFPFFWNFVFCRRGSKFKLTERMGEPPPGNGSNSVDFSDFMGI